KKIVHLEKKNMMKTIQWTLSVLLICCITSLSQAQTTATPKRPAIYNPEADAQADIAAAVAKAAQAGKHVFVQVGGNWCGWCIKFHDLVDATPELKAYLNNHY